MKSTLDENWRKSRTISPYLHAPPAGSRHQQRTCLGKHWLHRKARRSSNPGHVITSQEYKKRTVKWRKLKSTISMSVCLVNLATPSPSTDIPSLWKWITPDCRPSSALGKAATLFGESSSAFTWKDTTFIPWFDPSTCVGTRLQELSPKNEEATNFKTPTILFYLKNVENVIQHLSYDIVVNFVNHRADRKPF